MGSLRFAVFVLCYVIGLLCLYYFRLRSLMVSCTRSLFVTEMKLHKNWLEALPCSFAQSPSRASFSIWVECDVKLTHLFHTFSPTLPKWSRTSWVKVFGAMVHWGLASHTCLYLQRTGWFWDCSTTPRYTTLSWHVALYIIKLAMYLAASCHGHTLVSWCGRRSTVPKHLW